MLGMKIIIQFVFAFSVIFDVACIFDTSDQVETVGTVGEKTILSIYEHDGGLLTYYVPDYVDEEEEYQWVVHVQQLSIYDDTAPSQTQVTISLGENSNSFKIPNIWFNNEKDVILRTEQKRLKICLDKDDFLGSRLEMLLTTRSPSPIILSLEVNVTKKWVEPLVNNLQQIQEADVLSVSQPVIKYFHTPTIQRFLNTTDYLLVRVTSAPGSLCSCSVVSIQEPGCPVFDTIGMMKRFSTWQTMLYNTTILVDMRRYPEGFVLVIAAAPTDDLCNVVEDNNRCDIINSNMTGKEVMKDVIITISANSNGEDYLHGTFVVAGVYLVIFVVSSVISAYGFRYDYYKFEDLTQMISEKLLFNQKQEVQRIKSLSTIVEGRYKGRKWLDTVIKQQNKDVEKDTACDNIEMIEEELFVDVDELDTAGIDVDDRHKSRLKKDLTLADLTKKIDDPTQGKSMYVKSDLHWVILIIVSVYYSLPTMQMVLNSNDEYDDTGNHDLCFYNHLCQKPLGKVRDFNHLFSNLGYIVFGLLFNCLVFLRKKNYKALSCTEQRFDPHLHGIPQQSGLYYAMGCALIMEGIMSGCYHICPATVTFQFDTTYMYLIAILMFIKLYQGRHPDVSCDAFKSYMGLGVALTLEAFSYYYDGITFWIIFCIIYFIFIITVGVNTYNIGVVKYDYKILWNIALLVFKELHKTRLSPVASGQCKAPIFRARLVLILIMSSFNVLLCLYFALNMGDYASNHLLMVFMGNLFLYMNYYVIMKFYCGERMTWMCYIYICCMLATGFPSLYFFTTIERSSDLSPAESRMLNRPCVLFNFYDYHDIWHFLGGAGVFFTFMFILNIDEDVKYKRRDKLFVF